jgi:hypothetical protein
MPKNMPKSPEGSRPESHEEKRLNTLLEFHLEDVKSLLSEKLAPEVMERLNMIGEGGRETIVTFRVKEPGGTAFIYMGGPEDQRIWNYDSGLTLEELKSIGKDKIQQTREYDPAEIDKENDEAQETSKKLALALEKAAEGVEHIEVGGGALAIVKAEVGGGVMWSGLVWKDSDSSMAELLPFTSNSLGYSEKNAERVYDEALYLFNAIRYLADQGHGEDVAELIRGLDRKGGELRSIYLTEIIEDRNESFSEQDEQFAKDVYKSCGVDNIEELFSKRSNITVTDRSDVETIPSKSA